MSEDVPGSGPRDGDSPASSSLRRALVLALAGPAFSLLDLTVRSFLVELGVARAHEGIVIGIGAVSCALALGAAALSRHEEQRAIGQSREVAFVCSLGTALGAFSAIVILSMLLPHVYLDGGATP